MPTKIELTLEQSQQGINNDVLSDPKEDNDREQAQRDKDMQRNLALIAKYFKNIYKPTNNNLRTSSNTRNKNLDTTPRYKKDNQARKFGNQRTMTIAGARETVGGQECRKLNRVTDSAYHKEKMLLCKQAEQGVPLKAEYTCVEETGDSNVILDSPDMCDNDIQNEQNPIDCDDKQCKSILAETSRTLGESNSIRDSCLVALQNKQTEFEKYKACNDRTVDYDKLEHLKAQLQDKNIAISELKKLNEKCKGKSVETKFDKPFVVRQPNAQRIPKPSVLGKPAPFSDSFERESFSQTMLVPKTNVLESLSKPVTRQILPQPAMEDVRDTTVLKPGMYRINTRKTYTIAPQLPQTSRNTNPCVSTSTRVIYKTNLSRPQLRSTQMKDKVVPNNSKVKNKKTKIEDHHRISRISKKTMSVTACNDSLKSKTSNVNDVCATCRKCLVDSDHFACVTKMLNDMNAKTKKPNVVSISTRKPKGHANKYVATPPKKTVTSKSTTQKSKSYYRMLYEKTSTVRFGNDLFAPILGYGDLVQGNITINRFYYIEGLNQNLFSVGQLCDADLEVAFWKSTNDFINTNLSHGERITNSSMVMASKTFLLNFDYINLLSKKDVVIGLPKLKYVKDQLCSSCEMSKAKRGSFKTKTVLSSKGRLNLLHMYLCGPMRVASINGKKYYVIVDDYSRYSWTLFLSSKDETLEVLKYFLTVIQRNLQALVITAKAIGTACYTQNRSIIIPTHEKMAYHIINDRKPSIKHLHIFGCTCYLTKDGENLDKMKEKGDSCILVGYSTQSKEYRVYNKKTRLIVESIHLRFDEIKEMNETFVVNDTLGLVPQ
nr:hypothetical protein [Tanacetum cinerariifolium]